MDKKNFSLGQVVCTRSIANLMEEKPEFQEEISQCLARYTLMDWGDLSEDDKQMNDKAISIEERILAAYDTSAGKIYIITEADRSVSTILFLSEY